MHGIHQGIHPGDGIGRSQASIDIHIATLGHHLGSPLNSSRIRHRNGDILHSGQGILRHRVTQRTHGQAIGIHSNIATNCIHSRTIHHGNVTAYQIHCISRNDGIAKFSSHSSLNGHTTICRYRSSGNTGFLACNLDIAGSIHIAISQRGLGFTVNGDILTINARVGERGGGGGTFDGHLAHR